MKVPRPFLKWVGGKTQLLPQLLKVLPSHFETYYEPFLGGGALFFELALERAVLSDVNKELIDCYWAVRDGVDHVITQLKRHRYEEAYYYEVRSQDPSKLFSVEGAARMIYLNKCGFNGLYRVNSKGQFNVPFGCYTNPTICDEENLRDCSEALKYANIRCQSFERVLDNANPGDLVYFDPPYLPVAKTSFVAYQKLGFDIEQQEKLAQIFDELVSRGVSVVLSNADAPWVRNRYKAYHIHPVQAARHVNSKADKRGPVGELIVCGYRKGM